MAPGQAAAVAEAFGVPAGRPVIAAIGRTDPVKGLDLLIDALGPLRGRAHLVAIRSHSTAQHPCREVTRTEAGLSVVRGLSCHTILAAA
jgi:hypothetical protein